MIRYASFALALFLSAVFEGPAQAAPWQELPPNDFKGEVLQTLFKWSPEGANSAPISRDCRRTALEKTLEDGGSAQSIKLRLNNWIENCEQELSRFSAGQFGVMLEYTNINHSLKSDPFARKVRFTLADGRKINAIVALKNDTHRRPLVVAKCGLYCDANESATMKSLFMHLFEESPFNVVLLASSTGSEFSIDNQAVAFGGFDEGYQILDVVRQIMSPNGGFPERVSSVHVVGFSMGSQAVMYSALYSSQPENNLPRIDSALAICPVVDLGATIKAAFTPTLRGFYYEVLSMALLRRIFQFVPILGDLLNIDRHLTRPELYRGITEAAVTYYKNLTSKDGWGLAPLKGLRITKADDLWGANRFQDMAGKVNVPLMLVHMKDDYFVESKLNSVVLENVLAKNPNDSIGIASFSRGNHCAISAANGWETMTTLMRSFVLAHSPDAQPFLPVARVSIGDSVNAWRWPQNFHLWRGESVVGAGWYLKANEDVAHLEIRVFNPAVTTQNGTQCFRSADRPALAPIDCVRVTSGTVPLTRFSPQGLRKAANAHEAQAMSRWLNTNSEIVTAAKEPFIGATTTPEDVVIRGRYEQ
jgi:predicted alpha/beta-fold hydrolase